MALQFQPMKLDAPDLFGVRLTGTVGRGDRDRLKELADKCLLNGKVNVVLDLSELGNMGGGGAKMIAELQTRLAEADGGASIAGAGETIQRFLNQNPPEKPLNYYASVEEALAQLQGLPVPTDSDEVSADIASEEQPKTEDQTPVEQNDSADDNVDPDLEVGAVAFMDDEGTDDLDGMLDDFTVAETKQGRRKDHHFASLEETISLLGNWADRESQMDFTQVLKNLLFSQGLAEDVTLLAARGGLLISPDGYKEIPLDGALAAQIEEIARPMTMLDVRDDDLAEEELLLLETIDPDMILPIMRKGVLSLLVFVKKGGEEHDYSVAENFAFELLQQILEKTEQDRLNADRMKALESAVAKNKVPSAVRPQGDEEAPAGNNGFNGIMLHMSLDMPEADDLPHFWRLFARHVQSKMVLEEMAFVTQARAHPQIMLGGNDALVSLEVSDAQLQKYFQGMQIPVKVENLPQTFGALKKELTAGGSQWIIPLRDEDLYLGTLLVKGTVEDGGEIGEDLAGTFALAGKLLGRFEDSNEDADVFLSLIYRLMAQREKRFFGSDAVTEAIVNQLNLLALEMGFPADQKRDLIYGCLLRDVGLMDKDDALMGSPANMTPNQWKEYRNHPSEGASLLADMNLSQTVLEVVKCHHERFNGEGFPAGISGRDIPLAARVVTVVENYVSMTRGAGGMEPMDPQDAAKVLRENLGERYDPDIVGIFLSVVGGMDG